MRVVLVGGGGREHALALRLLASPKLSMLAVTKPNLGWPEGVTVLGVEGTEDIVQAAVDVQADLVVVGPEGPLAEGLVDALSEAGILAFGPTQAAAKLESSKFFAKKMMREAKVPTASYLKVDRTIPHEVKSARKRCSFGSVVVKVDGLAGGKGVIVCDGPLSARQALDEVWSGRFGSAANRILIEERLTGPEVSLFALTDGKRVIALPVSQDHKTLNDDDMGPNTGGMGAYAPCPLVSPEQADAWVQLIHLPVIKALARRGITYRGVLYAGLMLTENGPKVIEFNVRFGDPECQAIMALWDDDLLPWLEGAAKGELPPGRPKFRSGAACCVVVVSPGYPKRHTDGIEIPEPPPQENATVHLVGTRRDEQGVLRTAGGRVFGITGVGETVLDAANAAYDAVEAWQFKGAHYRTDIGEQVCSDL